MSTIFRRLGAVILLGAVLAACNGSASATPGASATPIASPSAAASASPSLAGSPNSAGSPSAAVCADAAAFRASMTALANLKLVSVGTSGVKAAVTDVQTSAEALLVSGKDLVAPPLTDLISAVQGLQATLAGLGDQSGLGAKLVAVQAGIVQVRSAASNVETALGTACPTP